MLRERIVGVFLVAALGIVLGALFRPVIAPSKLGDATTRNWFFINKSHQTERYDIVVVGDSRALRGVSPAAMSPLLDGRTVFNFAYHAGGMNKQMYSAAERLLRSDADTKCLLLSPTALAFMAWKEGNSQYREYLAKPRDEVWLYRNARPFAQWLRPIPPSDPVRAALGQEPHLVLEEDFRADGWIATDQVPHDDLSDLEPHVARLRGQSTEQRLVSDFMEQTRQWTGHGIIVAAFWHPAYEPRVQMEERILGFDPAEFVRRFEAAGGVWLEPVSDSYDSYDGSHLTRESAERFSRHLARALAEAM